MELESNTYMLYGIFFIFILLGGLLRIFQLQKKTVREKKKRNDPRSNRRSPETGKGVDGGTWEETSKSNWKSGSSKIAVIKSNQGGEH